MEDEADLGITAPSRRAEVFAETPFVETCLRVGTIGVRLFKDTAADAFDMGHIDTKTKEQAVVVVRTAREAPFFGTPSESVFLTLPNVALWHGTAEIISFAILIDVDEVGLPSGIDVVRETVHQIIL